MTPTETFTVDQLADAVKANDDGRVRQILDAQPDLIRTDMAYENEHQVVHYAVYARLPEMVRLLMERGADARKGVWPHRAATTAFVIARDRDYGEIVAIIEEEENRRNVDAPADSDARARTELRQAFDRNDEDGILRMLAADTALVKMHDWPLHAAACKSMQRLAAWLLDHGYDVNRSRSDAGPPIDFTAGCAPYFSFERARNMAAWLLEHGAMMTPRAAVMLGDVDWLRARHGEGNLKNPPFMARDCAYGGLLSVAAVHDRLDVTEVLLDLGFDPDERAPIEGTDRDGWGGPLEECAQWRRLAVAEMLLERGADPNPQPHIGKAPIAWAYEKRNTAMIELLRRFGAVAHPVVVGGAGDLDGARRLLADEAAGKLPEGLIGAEETVGDLLGWSGAAHGHPEIVRLALPHIPWARDDARWWWMLWHPLYRCLECFQLALERCDADVSLYFGRTILHDVVGIHGRDRKGDAVGFASAALDAGGRLDVRDELLKSTPLGWACRWGLRDVVRLFLERGADPVETDAEAWARPRAWAEKMHHREILELLDVARLPQV